MTDSRPCTRCKGTGKLTYDTSRDCFSCNGTGTFEGIDLKVITDPILTGKSGSKGRKFRASWPSKLNPWRNKERANIRAYYIWRHARFYGGADVTLPMTAIDTSMGDPFVKELDYIARTVAKKFFGTAIAGTSRWGRLLTNDYQNVDPGLPASAYENGPVVTEGQKPDFEVGEL